MHLLNTDHKKENIVLLGSIILTGIAIFVIANLRFIFWDFDLFPYLEPGKITHYYINYLDFGFTKRGLVGSFLAITYGYPTVSFISYLAFFIGITTCCIAAYLIYKLRNYFNKWSYILFASFVVFNSGTFMNLGYDLGRFDQLLIICSILSFYLIREGTLIKVIAISAIGLLIHEMYLIMFFPLLFYVVVFYSNFSSLEILYLLLGIVIVAGILFFFGKIESKSVDQIAQTISVEGFSFLDAGIIWKRTLEDNILYTVGFISDLSFGQSISIIYGGLYTLLIFVLLIMISSFNEMDWYGYIVILLTSSPIFFLAIDYSRWYSLIIINGFIYFGFCIFSGVGKKNNKVILTREHKWATSLLLIIGAILGPIGIIRSFPLFDFF